MSPANRNTSAAPPNLTERRLLMWLGALTLIGWSSVGSEAKGQPHPHLVYAPEAPSREPVRGINKVGNEINQILDQGEIPLPGLNGNDNGDSSLWMVLAFLFGIIGASYFVYGKKQNRYIILLCGILLSGFTYLVTQPLTILAIGTALCVAPAVLKRYGVDW